MYSPVFVVVYKIRGDSHLPGKVINPLSPATYTQYVTT